MTDIFLSYNREDQARAKQFADAFAAQGFKVWWDVGLKTGEAYDQVTENALRTAKAVVVLWSKKSVDSRWVRAEATLADRNRTLAPCMIEPCERPIMFELTQTAELSHWKGDTSDSAWQAFLDDVKRFLSKNDATATDTAASMVPAAEVLSAQVGPPSIAILPFTNRSGLVVDEVFAEGMVEDIVAALSLGGNVRVLASSATAACCRGLTDLSTIAKRLGARYLLEGNVRRFADRLRVTAQLIEGVTVNIVWTQRFDYPLANLAELQEEMITEIAGSLGVQVLRAEMAKALRKPNDLTAWEALMRSVAAAGQSGGDSIRTTIAEARRALEIAPNYGVAHATLALALGTLFAWRGSDDESLAHESLAHAEGALGLDSQNPSVLWRVAQVFCLLGRAQEALPHAVHAVEVNPNMDATQRALGLALAYLGRSEEALVHLDAGDRLAPCGPFLHVSFVIRSIAHFKAGHFTEALEAAEASLRLNPRFGIALLNRILCFARLEQWDLAHDAMRRFRNASTSLTLERLESTVRNGPWSEPIADAHVGVIRKLWERTAQTN